MMICALNIFIKINTRALPSLQSMYLKGNTLQMHLFYNLLIARITV